MALLRRRERLHVLRVVQELLAVLRQRALALLLRRGELHLQRLRRRRVRRRRLLRTQRRLPRPLRRLVRRAPRLSELRPKRRRLLADSTLAAARPLEPLISGGARGFRLRQFRLDARLELGREPQLLVTFLLGALGDAAVLRSMLLLGGHRLLRHLQLPLRARELLGDVVGAAAGGGGERAAAAGGGRRGELGDRIAELQLLSFLQLTKRVRLRLQLGLFLARGGAVGEGVVHLLLQCGRVELGVT